MDGLEGKKGDWITGVVVLLSFFILGMIFGGELQRSHQHKPTFSVLPDRPLASTGFFYPSPDVVGFLVNGHEIARVECPSPRVLTQTKSSGEIEALIEKKDQKK